MKKIKRIIALLTTAALALGIAATATAESATTPPRYTVTVIEEQGKKFQPILGSVTGNGVVLSEVCRNSCPNRWYVCGCHAPILNIHNAKGEVLLADIKSAGSHFYEKDEKKFFINDNGEFIYTDFEFTFAKANQWLPEQIYLDGLYVVEIKNAETETALFGVIDSRSRLVIPAEYDEITFNGNGFVTVKNQSGVGIYNKNGTVIIPPTYDELFVYPWEGLSDLAFVRTSKWGFGEDDKHGLINNTGKIIVPIDKGGVWPLTKNLVSVIRDGKQGAVNFKGETVIPFEYELFFGSPALESFNPESGLFSVRKDGKMGILNEKGEVVFPFEYRMLRGGDGHAVDNRATKELVVVYSEDFKCGVINLDKEVVVPIGEYDSIQIVRNDLLLAQKNGLSGLLNAKGEVVVPVRYSDVRWFTSSLIAVKSGNKWGFYNVNGELVVSYIYDGISQLRKLNSKLEIVGAGDKWGAINAKGEVVIPIIYTAVLNQENGYFRAYNSAMLFGGEIYTPDGRKTDREEHIVPINNEFNRVFISRLDANGHTNTTRELRGKDGEVLIPDGDHFIHYAGSEGNTFYFWYETFCPNSTTFERLWGIIAVTVMTDCCLVCEHRPNAGRRGFVLGKEKITISDALEILKHIVGLSSLIDNCDNARAAASIVGDAISTADALEILKHIVGLTDLTLD